MTLTTNRGSRDYKTAQLLGIINRGRFRDYKKWAKGLQIGAGIANWCRICQGLFFDKFAGMRPATLLKKRLWHSCFPVNFAKLLKATFLQNTSGRLLLRLLLVHHAPGSIHFFSFLSFEFLV